MFVLTKKQRSCLRRRCGLLAPLLLSLLLLAGLAAAPGASGAERQFELTLIEGEPLGGAPTFQVTQGDEVAILVTSDGEGELHLHGYDLALPLEPGQVTALRFQAGLSGRYPAALHHHRQGGGGHGTGALFYLEVYPQ
jgi:hypothetical protein